MVFPCQVGDAHSERWQDISTEEHIFINGKIRVIYNNDDDKMITREKNEFISKIESIQKTKVSDANKN